MSQSSSGTARLRTGAPVRADEREAAGRRRGERPRLSVLDRRALEERSQLRRSRLLLATSALVLAGALGGIACAEGLVASQQLHLDAARQQLSAAAAQEQQLLLTKARLEAPSRVLGVAEHQLHMVRPAKVTYLSPVSLGPSPSSAARASSR